MGSAVVQIRSVVGRSVVKWARCVARVRNTAVTWVPSAAVRCPVVNQARYAAMVSAGLPAAATVAKGAVLQILRAAQIRDAVHQVIFAVQMDTVFHHSSRAVVEVDASLVLYAAQIRSAVIRFVKSVARTVDAAP
jgi:hypothetical protein